MNITIKPLTPGLSADYFDFFENRAFTDNSPYRCYCQVYQMSKEQQKAEFGKVDEADIGHVSRKVAEQWETTMKKITSCGYIGATALEVIKNTSYESLTCKEFLNLAYERAKRLDEFRNKGSV